MGGNKSKEIVHPDNLAYYQVLPSGVILYIYPHDITTLEVDAIINPTTSRLDNNGIGVSGTIGKKAGVKLQKDCDKYIKKHGEIEVGDNVDTKGYNVCKKLIHVATPEWLEYNENNPRPMQYDLYSAFYKSFEKAIKLKARTLAVPPIGLDSSRLQQDRVDIIVEVLYRSIMEFDERTPKKRNTLKQIHVVDMNETVITTIATTFHRKNGFDMYPEMPTASMDDSGFAKVRQSSSQRSKRKLMGKHQIQATEPVPLPENMLRPGWQLRPDVVKPEPVRAQPMYRHQGYDPYHQQFGSHSPYSVHTQNSTHTPSSWNNQYPVSQNNMADFAEIPLGNTARHESEMLNGKGTEMSMHDYNMPDVNGYGAPKSQRRKYIYNRHPIPQQLHDYGERETGHEQIDGNEWGQPQYGKSAPGLVNQEQTDPYKKHRYQTQQNPDFLPEPVNVSYKQVLVQGPTIYVYRGDITTLNVDVIVNAANSHLQHSGGVAKAIAKKAGRQLEEEGYQLVKRLGSIPVGENVVTKGYNLPSKYVIHSVGPVWSQYSGDTKVKCISDLYNAYFNSLTKAVELKAKTVAIPAISAGTFAVPHEIVTNVMWDAVMDHTNKTPSIGNTLKQIHLVNIDDTITEAIALTFKAKEKLGAEPHEQDPKEFFNSASSIRSESSESQGEYEDDEDAPYFAKEGEHKERMQYGDDQPRDYGFPPAQNREQNKYLTDRNLINTRNDGQYDTRQQYAQHNNSLSQNKQQGKIQHAYLSRAVNTKGWHGSTEAHGHASNTQNLPKPGNSHIARNPPVGQSYQEQKIIARSDRHADTHNNFHSGAYNNSQTDQSYKMPLKEPFIDAEQKAEMRYPTANFDYGNSRYKNPASNKPYKSQWQQEEQGQQIPRQDTQRTNYGIPNYQNYNTQLTQQNLGAFLPAGNDYKYPTERREYNNLSVRHLQKGAEQYWQEGYKRNEFYRESK